MTHTSLTAALSAWADTRADDHALTFVDSAGAATSTTYGQLDEGARTVAGHLRSVAAPGDRALLLFPPGLDYVTAFLGCLYANVVAVPLYPPGPNARLDRVTTVVRDCGATHALTTAKLVEPLSGLAAGPDGPALHPIEAVRAQAAAVGPHRPGRDDLAFLQYTSGSTGDPKGVMVGHGNLTDNHRAIAAGFGITGDDVVLSWLPMYHDMGLIGTTLLPLFVGVPAILLDTFAFVRDPLRWPAEVSRFQATCSGGPNFAYQLLADRFDAGLLDGVDLSSWRVAFNGAEPVDRRTMDAFSAAYAPLGFDRRACYPCYGLAEATLFVSGPEASTGYRASAFDRDALETGRLTEATAAAGTDPVTLVSCGTPPPGTTVAVRRADGEACAAGEVGEICVSSGGVAAGYWGRSDSAATFAATVGGQPGTFLRTGDLGAMYDGELYVAGRQKDLIIRAGRNHHPHDIETVATAGDEHLRRGGAAAFQPETGGQRVALVVEASRRGLARLRADPALLTSLTGGLRRRVATECGLDLDDVVVVLPGAIPKTSSGKIRRRATREQFVDGRLKLAVPTVAPVAPAADTHPGDRSAAVEQLVRRYANLTGSELDQALPLAALGLGSLRLIELKAAVERLVHGTLDTELFFGDRSVAELVAAAADPGPVAAPLPARTGAVGPASAGQVELHFYDEVSRGNRANNLAIALRVSGRVEEKLLRAAIDVAVARHPALRTTLGPLGSGAQTVHDQGTVDWECRAFPDGPDEAVRAYLHERAYRPFDLVKGPLVRAGVAYPPDGTVLLVACHHAVVDHWSLQLLLAEILPRITGGDAPPATARPGAADASDWARLQQQARLAPDWQDRVAALAEKWRPLRELVLFPEQPARARSPRRRPDPDRHRAGWIDFEVAPDVVPLLHRHAARRGFTPFVPLLAAYAEALHQVTGEPRIVIGTPHHGRTDQRFAGTVGYLVNMVPVLGDLTDRPDPPTLEERLWRELRAALSTADVPFSDLVRALAADRHGQNPLFQATLTLQQPVAGNDVGLTVPWSRRRRRIGSRDVETFDVPPVDVAFATSLYGALDAGGLTFRLVHQRTLVPAEAAAEVCRRFSENLVRSVRRPSTPLAHDPVRLS
ncbi:AMP-binding protein [Micromonospora sp. C31]|uniref:fatty acyl-AMP ligase n=1 Tax=Micromonospora sp. C31 TaxID=2824876 RepID=UPI001B37AC33|nr:fatty acyl-AMP ligase [Micromonospora sp. C31]MBQ1075174.1 AMP-binding protein [Micromonospora sp. C31]